MQTGTDASAQITNKLLLLTDHADVTPVIRTLRSEGYVVQHRHCQQFEAGLLEVLLPDAVLIDLESPSIESISICRTLRAYHEGPILVLAAQSNDLIQMLGLEMGADDVLFKPQSESYLLVKLRAFLRRSEKQRQRQRMVQLGELVIDSARREVWCSGKTISLTAREFDLLWCLAQNAKTIVSRDEIHRSLYNCEYNGFDRSIDIYVSRIRQKIGDDPHNPRYLKTIRGAGYLLVENHL